VEVKGEDLGMARVGIEPTTPRFSASSAVFARLRLLRFSLLNGGFRDFTLQRFSAVFGQRVDLVLTPSGIDDLSNPKVIQDFGTQLDLGPELKFERQRVRQFLPDALLVVPIVIRHRQLLPAHLSA
jgi:hypothetical protein